MNILWLDYETYSDVPIRNGTHAYAESVEIILVAWAIDNGTVNVWDRTESDVIPELLYQALTNSSVEIYAHNSHFDRTVLRHAMPELAPLLNAGVTQWCRR